MRILSASAKSGKLQDNSEKTMKKIDIVWVKERDFKKLKHEQNLGFIYQMRVSKQVPTGILQEASEKEY